MNELFLTQQQPRVTELDPDFTIAAGRAISDDAWTDPHTLLHLYYRLALVGA